ncbi:phage holin family protein [Synechococcus sp. CCY 9618]|uniref:phage holin family protein n=1 Tax=Synechococcus sp. CCY 9618 TaxID=2815602 RepID=UPI001C21D572|nr:phage holin family protein [Synechococcus sp. CCY 9618]
MGSFAWLLQWPVRALILLLVAKLPVGMQMASFPVALLSAIVIGLLGTLLIVPLKLLLGPVWFVSSLGGLISPVSFLFNWLITIVLFGLAAWLIDGFRLQNGLVSAILGGLAYSILSSVVLRFIGLEIPLTRAMGAAAGLG